MKTSKNAFQFLSALLIIFSLFFPTSHRFNKAWAQAEGGAERAGSQRDGYDGGGGSNSSGAGGNGGGDVNSNSLSGFGFNLANSIAGQMAMAAAIGQMDPGVAMAMGLTSGMLDTSPNPFSGVASGGTMLVNAQTLIAIAVAPGGKIAVGLVSANFAERKGQVAALTAGMGSTVSVSLRTQ